MHEDQHFQRLYGELANIWEAHQQMRHGDVSVPELADSANRVNHARMAMWDWHRHNTPERY